MPGSMSMTMMFGCKCMGYILDLEEECSTLFILSSLIFTKHLRYMCYLVYLAIMVL
jgi:hypothetical protein